MKNIKKIYSLLILCPLSNSFSTQLYYTTTDEEFEAQLAQALRESEESSQESSRVPSPSSPEEENDQLEAALKASREEEQARQKVEDEELQKALRLAKEQKEKDEKLAQEQWDKLLKDILERSQKEEWARQEAVKQAKEQEMNDFKKALQASETSYKEEQRKKYPNLNEYAQDLHIFNVDSLEIPSLNTQNIQNIPVMRQKYINCMWHALINALVIMKKLQNQDFTVDQAYETLLNICSSNDIATLNAHFDKFYEKFNENHAPNLQETIAVSSDLVFASEQDQIRQISDDITATDKITHQILNHRSDENYFLPILINDAQYFQKGGDSGNHWYLFLIHIKNGQIQYYVADSLGYDRSDAQPVQNLIQIISTLFNQ